MTEASTSMCEKFLCYFIDKVASVRQNASVDLSEFVPADPFYSAVFGEFKPLSSLGNFGEFKSLCRCSLRLYTT